MTNLLIVESPAKAKTIAKYLGPKYVVLASFGHVRDLPSKNGSVDPEKNFAMNYQISTTAKKHINEIAKMLYRAKYVDKAPKEVVDDLIQTIQADCFLVANDKQEYVKKDKVNE